jgi:hypothetical protein
MKRIKASEARKHWFQLLDDALRGEIIAVERKGQRVVLRREDVSPSARAASAPSYRALLKVPLVDEADQWSWKWGAERGLTLRKRPRK